jgi:hypothetical protein
MPGGPLWIIGAVSAAACVAALAHHLCQEVTLPIPYSSDSTFRQASVGVGAAQPGIPMAVEPCRTYSVKPCGSYSITLSEYIFVQPSTDAPVAAGELGALKGATPFPILSMMLALRFRHKSLQ